jgi:uncharacterized protein (DUF433 family)
VERVFGPPCIYCIFDSIMNRELINRITVNPDICHGRPTIRNTRYTVDLILDLLSAGMSEKEIMDDYPALELLDIKACLSFASQLTRVKSVAKVVA